MGLGTGARAVVPIQIRLSVRGEEGCLTADLYETSHLYVVDDVDKALYAVEVEERRRKRSIPPTNLSSNA